MLIARVSFERLSQAVRSVLDLLGSRRLTGVPPSFRPDDRILEFALAGVIHHDGGRPALGLKLRERVWLRREPGNAYDANAVEVLSGRGRSFGHLPRHVAEQLSPALNAGLADTSAMVTGLRTDPAGRTVGITIAITVRRELDLHLPSRLEFACDQGDEGAVYILLNCDSALLDEIQDGLNRRGLACERAGQAFRPATDGNSYQWYIRMAEGVKPEQVERYFAEAFGVGAWTPPLNEAVDGYVKAFDGEVAAKEGEIIRLREAIDVAEEQARQAKRVQREASVYALRGLIAAVLPRLQLLGDSWDVLSREVAEPEDVLKELHAICCSPAECRARVVQGARDWREVHFSTGQRDNGRLYFRHGDGRVDVLIAFKGTQNKDVQYLARR